MSDHDDDDPDIGNLVRGKTFDHRVLIGEAADAKRQELELSGVTVLGVEIIQGPDGLAANLNISPELAKLGVQGLPWLYVIKAARAAKDALELLERAGQNVLQERLQKSEPELPAVFRVRQAPKSEQVN